jgi:hypothetical protein
MIQSYENLGHVDFNRHRPLLLEVYAGKDIAQWWGNILRQLQDMKSKAEEVNNDDYATQLSRFIRTWTENEITGSMNIEDIRTLKTAAEWAGELPWNFKNYFTTLANQLRKLVASTEELPMTPQVQGGNENGGGGGAGPSPTAGLNPEKDPAAPQFGAEENPGDMELPADQKVNKEGDEEDIAADIQMAIDSSKNV